MHESDRVKKHTYLIQLAETRRANRTADKKKTELKNQRVSRQRKAPMLMHYELR